MIEWNFIAVLILIAHFVLWKLDLAATLLNLGAFPASVPAPLQTLMDQAGLDRARAYGRTNAVFSIIRASAGLGLFLAFWLLGGFGLIDQWSRDLAGDHPILTGLIFLGTCFLGQSLIDLPFSYYDTFVIEQRFGFNRSTPAVFWGDFLKSLLMTAILGGPLIALVLWIFRSVPNAWLWAWAAFTGFQLLLTYLAPTLILPLFNRFTPMPDSPLRKKIEALGEQCGFPLHGVFVMDGSKRSSKANAFFTGFGKRKKIALFDTLMEKHDDDELLAVLAHEIGHFRCGHIRQRLAVSVVQTAVIFFLLGLATNPHGAFAASLFKAFGVSTISPHVGILLFLILFGPVSRLLGVFANAWSRKHEFEADAFANHAIGSPAPLSSALRKLSSDQLAHPSPHRLRVLLEYSHPPLLQRLEAMK